MEYPYVKSVRIRSFSGPYFPAFGLNTDETNSEYGHFLRSVNSYHNLIISAVLLIGTVLNRASNRFLDFGN